jgi:hypothetical protein
MAALPRPVSYWFPAPGAHDDSALLALRASFIDGPGRRGHEAIHVLLIEDDPAIADMYRVQLEYDGYCVTVAPTGEVGYAAR